MNWEEKLSKAIKKVSNDILNMSDDEFKKELEKHKDGDIAGIIENIL